MSALRGRVRPLFWPRPRRLCAFLGIVLAGAVWVRVAHAQMQASEVEVKAAFIYNFALFTTWPAGAIAGDAPMVLCVSPDHPLRAALQKLTGKSVRGHRLQIRSIDNGSVAGCHVLVIDDHVGTVPLDAATPVLTVSDTGKAVRAGGGVGPIVALALQDNRVVFDIDAAAARQAHLDISSQLLRLARSVQ